MGPETLDPGEWGPFEELAAAAAEILRLRAVLRSHGVDPDDPALVPRGHLVFQPERAEDERGRAHRTVEVAAGGQSAPIDEAIAPLLREVWEAGLRTVNSCQDNPRGHVWLEFASGDDAKRFVDIAAGEGGRDSFGLYRRAFRDGPAAFWPMSQGLWLYKLLPQDRGASAPGAGVDAEFLVSIRFPHQDLSAVVEALRKHNGSGGG